MVSIASLTLRQRITRRCDIAMRPTCRVYATSAIFVPGLLCKYSCNSLDAFPSAVSVLAESANNCHEREGPLFSRQGASSNIMCAFVPPMPKELIPARLGLPLKFHSLKLEFI